MWYWSQGWFCVYTGLSGSVYGSWAVPLFLSLVPGFCPRDLVALVLVLEMAIMSGFLWAMTRLVASIFMGWTKLLVLSAGRESEPEAEGAVRVVLMQQQIVMRANSHRWRVGMILIAELQKEILLVDKSAICTWPCWSISSALGPVLYTPPPIPSGFPGNPRDSTWNGRNPSGFLGIPTSSRWNPHGMKERTYHFFHTRINKRVLRQGLNPRPLDLQSHMN